MPQEITDTVNEKTMLTLKAIIMNFREELRESIESRTQRKTGSITNVDIASIAKHEGAGGKTFIIQGKFQTTQAGLVDGGIVIKFAGAQSNLPQEVNNANNLEKLLKMRQKQWDERLKERDLPEKFQWLPNNVFAPKVIAQYENSNCIILEFISECTPLIKSPDTEAEKFFILGYALGRLHGTKRMKVEPRLYEPLYRVLAPYVSQQALDYWKWIIENSEGGVQAIHGDSHLENILRVGKSSLAWIDAQLIPHAERFDDLSYGISHVMQEEIADNIQNKKKTLKDFIQPMTEKYVKHIIPVTISAYKQTTDLSGIYSQEIPVDFFLGSHLIIRSELWETEVKEALIYLGQYFINQRPVNFLLQNLATK